MRIDFTGKEKEFKKWLEDHVEKGKYELYLTDENEVIARPGVSTKTYDIGYFKGSDKDKKDYEEYLKNKELLAYKIHAMEWDTEKPPGIRVPSD